jgi:hypothetical protein
MSEPRRTDYLVLVRRAGPSYSLHSLVDSIIGNSFKGDERIVYGVGEVARIPIGAELRLWVYGEDDPARFEARLAAAAVIGSVVSWKRVPEGGRADEVPAFRLPRQRRTGPEMP